MCLLPGDVGIELQCIVSDKLAVMGIILLLQKFSKVINPDLQPQLGPKYLHPDRGSPVRDVLQSHIRPQHLLLDVKIDLLRLGVKVLVQEGQHEGNGPLLLHVCNKPRRLVALLHALIRVNKVGLQVGSYIKYFSVLI